MSVKKKESLYWLSHCGTSRSQALMLFGGWAADAGGSQYSIGEPPTLLCSRPTGVSPPSISNKLLPVYQQTAENAAGKEEKLSSDVAVCQCGLLTVSYLELTALIIQIWSV